MDKPSDLGELGSAFWDDTVLIVEDIRPDEYRLLELAARTLDDIGELDDVFNVGGRQWSVKGSTGQPVINPLRSERRFLIDTFSKLCRQLQIPDSEERAIERADVISRKMAGLGRRSAAVRHAA